MPMKHSEFFVDLVREQRMKIPLPDGPLDGKVVIITGSNRGLGLEAARHVVRLNAHTVVLAVRNLERGKKAKKDIIKSQPQSETRILVWEIDLRSFESTRAFADRVSKELTRLDALILNAAVVTEKWQDSRNGWEMSLQVNILSGAYLSLLLYPKLVASGPSGSTVPPHISFVSSDLYMLLPFKERHAPHILHSLNDKSRYRQPRGLSKYNAPNILVRYKTSKLLEVYFARALAEYAGEHDAGKIVVNVLNPGFCHSDAGKDVYTGIRGVMFWLFKLMIARSTECGGRTLVHASTQCGMETNGGYLSACKIKFVGEAVSGPEGPELQEKIWHEFGEIMIDQDPTLSRFFEIKGLESKIGSPIL